MRRRTALTALVAIVAVHAAMAQAPLSTAFTYQGQLEDGANPANAAYDFTFRLFDAATVGVPIGGLVTVNDLLVSDGLFTTQLNFGSSPFVGDARWLEIAVRPGASGGAYTTLTPRQPLTATPYALYALNSPTSGGGPWALVGANIHNTNTGDVGIGTAAPQRLLHTVGDAVLFERASNDAAVILRNTLNGTLNTSFGLHNTGASAGYSYLSDETQAPLLYLKSGNVGIGTLAPAARLEITDSAGVALRAMNTGTGFCAQFSVNGTTDPAHGIYSVTYGGGYAGSFEAHNTNATAALNAYKNGGPALRCTSTFTTPGTAATDCVVAITGGTDTELSGGGFLVIGSVASTNISIDNNEIEARSNGNSSTLIINNDGGDVIISPQGTTRVRVLEITGADVAEKFPVSDAEVPKPGMVMMIDAKNAGKLCLSNGAYNKRVAGIVSGANGLPAGTILGNLPGNEDAPAIALSGRVWVHCDARDHAIDVGDMLTTSNTPGHAMAATDVLKLTGAVIGKAMTALPQGENGMVLVLVNLQ